MKTKIKNYSNKNKALKNLKASDKELLDDLTKGLEDIIHGRIKEV